MYKVTCLYDGETYTLHNPLTTDLRIYSDKVVTASNDPGSFSFSLPYNHPYIDKVVGLSSYICVYDDDDLIFAGRPINDGEDIYRARTFECEGELAFLYDSIQPRREIHDMTPLEMFTLFIEEHNSQVADSGPIDKTFEIGVVTVTDSNDSLYRYTNRETTLDDIQNKLIDSLGGHLNIRHEDGVRYIDWLADVETVSDQPIQLGSNLLTYAKDTDYTEIATACIPLGAMLDESEISALTAYVTCADANDGSEVVQLDEAVETYGFICKIIQYENATTAEYLLSVAQEWLTDGQYADMTLTMTAVDLHAIGYDVDPIRVNTQVRVISESHGMDRYFEITERTYHISQPESDTVTIGSTEKQKSYTSSSASTVKTLTETTDSTSKKIDALIAEAADNVTALLNQATHGYVVLDPNDGPERILIMDTNSTDTATKIWKWDLNGLGYSSTGINGPWGTAITMNGQIVANYIATGELDASLIKVGIIQDVEGLNYWNMETGELSLSSYATVEYTDEQYEAAVDAAGEETDEKLVSYYTIGEVNSLFETSANSILLTVSGTYATQTSVTDAISTAESYTDSALTSYSTTAEMNTAISEAVSSESASILLTVSGTYATQTSVTTAVADAVDEAESYTDSALTNYTTTADMTTAIEEAVSSESASILLTVSGTYATQTSVTDAISTAESYTDSALTSYSTTAEIEAYVDDEISSITLSVTGALGDSASIKLSTGSSATLDLTDVREAFRDDTTAITISAGTIAFSSSIMSISSTYCTLTRYGVLSVTGATVSGKITSISGYYTTEIANGYIQIYYNDELYGRITPIYSGSEAKYYSLLGDTDNCGAVSLGIGTTGYIFVNNTVNPNGYSERVQISGTSRFTGTINCIAISATGSYTTSGVINCTRTTSEAQVNLTNNYAAGRLAASTAGNFGVYDVNNSSWLIYSNSSGTHMIPAATIAGGSICSGRFYIYNENLYLAYGTYGSDIGLFVKGGGLYVDDYIACGGTKSRVVETENYGTVTMNAFETASALFGDVGSGTIGEDGTLEVFFDDVFSETIDLDADYQVFTTQTSAGSIEYIEKQYSYFVVYGTAGTTLDWAIYAHQKDYTATRLEAFITEEAEDSNSEVEEILDADIEDYCSQEGDEEIEGYELGDDSTALDTVTAMSEEIYDEYYEEDLE